MKIMARTILSFSTWKFCDQRNESILKKNLYEAKSNLEKRINLLPKSLFCEQILLFFGCIA